jgi:transaldolase
MKKTPNNLVYGLIMPGGALKALAVHTEIGDSLPADGGNCEEILSQFAKAGVDVDALAARLQD